MKSKMYIILFLISVLISSCSQIILKNSAKENYQSKIKEIFNFRVFFAYGCFFCASLLTMLAYKGIPLSLGPVLEATGYVYIMLLSRYFLQEKLTKKKLVGNMMIIIGILISSLSF